MLVLTDIFTREILELAAKIAPNERLRILMRVNESTPVSLAHKLNVDLKTIQDLLDNDLDIAPYAKQIAEVLDIDPRLLGVPK